MDKRLFLIDGHALIFKMYYAFLKHPIYNSKREDMSILFGVTKYLLELVEKEHPTHLAVAFDPPCTTFRHELYPEYKGTREATPQAVIDAFEPLVEICKALRFPVLTVNGFEADDVICTVAKKAEKMGFTTYMVTPDKDYGQVVTENILQFKPGKSGAENEIFGPAEICAKYKIDSPSQVVDLLTICGDASDNVPGVKGVGEVGAGKLISKYGSVENIYSHINELTPKQQEAFRNAEDHIALSKTLVTIRTDVPVEADMDAMTVDGNYDIHIAELFDRYEFNSLKKYILHLDTILPQEEKKEILVDRVTPTEAIRAAVNAGRCSIVSEFDGDGIAAHVRRIIIGTVGPEGKYLAAEGTPYDFRELLVNGNVEKTGYDLKRLCNSLSATGDFLEGRLMDIELMHYLVNPETSHKMEVLAKGYLDISLEEQKSETVALSLFDEPEDEPKRDRDMETAVCLMLCDTVLKELESLEMDTLYYTMEEPLIRVLSKMECTGVKLDLMQLKRYAADLNKELDERRDRIREMAGEPDLNILSTKQIGTLIFEKLRLDPKVKAKTGVRYSYSTDEETLTALAHKHPIIDEILEYRAVKKLLSTYIEPFPELVSERTGKIHTTFNQALTATGRLSSSKPNLQNIPIRTERGKEIRKAFIPSMKDGVILSADYSQIELRIMAHLSCDKHLTEAFREGLDVHAITAAKIFGVSPEEVTPDQRRKAKTANFGIMYGISAFGLAQRLKVPRGEAKKIIDDYFANFPSISSFISDTLAGVREKGYAETLFGRRRYLPDINSKNAT
ncbi:MAG: DNA polymerase I, partial [Candidatus Cryptobacteroides sp.]